MNTNYANYGYGNPYSGYGNNGFPVQGGVMPGQGITQGFPVKSWLPEETIKKLTQTIEGFQISATPEEIERAVCNHRDVNGAPTFNPNEDGSYRCKVCGYNFNVTNNMSIEEVKQACDLVESILQTMKLMYVTLDGSIGREFFKIIAFIRKIPNMWVVAVEDYRKIQNVSGYTQGVPNSVFSIFDTLTVPGYSTPYGQPQPMYGQPNPQFTGQPQYNQPMYGQPQGQPYVAGSPFYETGAPNQQYAGQPYMNPPAYGQPQGQPQYNQPMYGQPQGQPYGQPQQNQGYSLNAQGAAAPNPASPNPQPVKDDKPATPVPVKDEFKA